MPQVLFSLDHICFSSRGSAIIQDVSLSIELGRRVAFTGRSGSGKSVLLKLAAGLIKPSSGTVWFGRSDIQRLSRREILEFRKLCAFVFQDAALWANQTILQNLSLPLQVHFPKFSARENRRTVERFCEKVGYTRPLTLRPADLSVGERKLVSFARALICEPSVLFLDDCTESMDRSTRARLFVLLDEFVSKGNTMVYVSHDGEFIRRYKDVVYVLDEGRVVRKIDGAEAENEI